MPLRMAGQYADEEVGLFYNYFRFYDPVTGRYIENDPIDLQGGLNRYGYVNGNPLHYIDPKGLLKWSGTVYSTALVAGVGANFIYFDLTSECVCDKKITIKGFASALAIGIGATLTGTSSNSEFTDYKQCPTADIAKGVFAAVSANIVLGGGAGWSATRIGHLYALPTGLMPSGPAYGYDYGCKCGSKLF